MASAEQPHLLLIDTSADACGVGLTTAAEIKVETAVHLRNMHSRLLADLVEGALKTADMTPADLSAIVLSAGPGSFTGLRIGYSFAKGLAHAAQIPVVEVPTLDIWGLQAGALNKPVVPIIDARRGEVFFAVYQVTTEGLTKHTSETLATYQAFAAQCPPDAVLSGVDALRLKAGLSEFLNDTVSFMENGPRSPQLWALAQLGHQKYIAGEKSDPQQCEPLYMRTFLGAT